MSVKDFIVTCVLFAFVSQCIGQDGGNCKFYNHQDPTHESVWPSSIELASIYDVEPRHRSLYNASFRNVREITEVIANNQPNKYVNTILVYHPEKNYTTFILTLSKEFEKYEEHEFFNILEINVKFLCDSGSSETLVIRQPIHDTNNHSPELLPSYYVFDTPVRLPADHLIGKISAQDFDLTNERIRFTFKATGQNVIGDFALIGTYRDPENPKVFHSWLVTTVKTVLTTNLTFAVTAQDSGYPQRSWSALVDLNVNFWSWTTTTPEITTENTTHPENTEEPKPPVEPPSDNPTGLIGQEKEESKPPVEPPSDNPIGLIGEEKKNRH